MDDLVFGLQITVLGLGIVFGVLILLWLLLTLALRFERRAATSGEARGAPPAAEPAPAGTVRLADAPIDLDPVLVAAVTIALLRHTEALRQRAAPPMRSYWPGSLLFASRWVAAGRMRQGQSWRRRR